MIELVKDHIQIPCEMHSSLFNNEKYVYASVVDDSKKIVLTPLSNTWFQKVHDAHSILIKEKNSDYKSLNIRPLLIDYDLVLEEGEREFEVIERTKILKIEI